MRFIGAKGLGSSQDFLSPGPAIRKRPFLPVGNLPPGL